jgi:hypothetical protein
MARGLALGSGWRGARAIALATVLLLGAACPPSLRAATRLVTMPVDPLEVDQFVVSPDGAYAVFVAGSTLYSTNIASGDRYELVTFPAFTDPAVAIQITPNSQRVIYRADQDTDGVFELYSVAIDRLFGTAQRISGALVAGGNVVGAAITPDSQYVVYLATRPPTRSSSCTARLRRDRCPCA